MRVWKQGLVGASALALALTGSVITSGLTMAQSPSPAAPAGSAAQVVVGVSWNNFQEPRWARTDEPAIKAVLEAAGAKYISTDAGSSATKQLTDVEQLISEGANVLIILAQDGTAIEPAVAAATAAGIPVIAYDRLIEDPASFYITFDNVEVGRMQAREILKAAPTGNYVFIKGNSADANADFLFGGQQEILKDALASGAIKNVGETYTDNWDPAKAQTEMEQFLTANNNNVQAVVAENDGMAGGVVAALTAQGLAGTVPVSGQDGDPAALNRVALGTQTVDVWKDSRALGTAAAQVALQLAAGTALKDVKDAQVFADGPNKVALESILLKPQPITKDNLCQNVPAGSVAACK